MKRWVVVVCCGLVALPGVASTARAQEIGPGVQEVRDCVERNAPRTGRQQVRLERTDRGGAKRSLEATAWWKRDEADRTRFLVRVEAPADERDSAFLFLEREDGENDLFTYLPELRTVRRISNRSVSGSFFGTDFSYEDVVELQGEAKHARIDLLPDEELDGRRVRVLQAVPSDASGSSYSRVVSRIDAETCAVLQVEMTGKSDKLVKEMRVAWADVEQDGERWRPRKVLIRDLEKQTETRLELGKGDWNADVPDRLFNQGELAKGR
jgi:hypothetical protein